MRSRSLLTAALALGLVCGGAALWLRQAVSGAIAPPSATVVELPAGTGAAGAARRLAEAGVIRSSAAWRLLAAWSGDSRRLQAGEYRFEGPATPAEVLERLVRGDVLLHPVTVPEGLTLAETLEILQRQLPDIQGSLAEAAADPSPIEDLDAKARNLEGYLFPDTYRFPRGVSAQRVVSSMVQRFRDVASELQQAPAAASTPAGIRAWVTLASLVEKETAVDEERGQVAGVFANRLRLGMPLQADPTVVYALADAGLSWDGSLARHLDLDHPYNTYRYPGLPPGPIANPGRAALAAARQPAVTAALYFVADGRGGHRFSRTLAEHNQAVRAWREAARAERRR